PDLSGGPTRRGRRLHRGRRHRRAGRHQHRPRPAGPSARGPAGNDRARRAAQVHHDQRLAALPANEHQLRPLSTSRHPHPRQAGAATPGRTARLGGLCRMDAAVRSFLTYLQVERGASPHTLRNYEGDLRQFLAFLRTAHNGSLPAPAGVDAYVVRGFLAARAGLVGLNVEDVDMDTGTATVLGKGRKERVVLLGTKAVEALRTYVGEEGAKRGPLFRNQRGGRLTARSVERIVAKECQALENFP